MSFRRRASRGAGLFALFLVVACGGGPPEGGEPQPADGVFVDEFGQPIQTEDVPVREVPTAEPEREETAPQPPQVLPAPAERQPLAASSPAVPVEVVVRRGDVLVIKVWPDAELGGEFPIEETGYVFLPVIGQFAAADKTIGLLRQELRASYGEMMRSPVVSVTPMVRVAVTGAVGRPGVLMVTPTETITDVIYRAGGFRENAKDDDVKLIRAGQEIDLELRTGAVTALTLQSGDQIHVPSGNRITMQGFMSVMQILTFGIGLWNAFQ